MGAPERSEKGTATSRPDLEISSIITSTQEHQPKKLHFVQRSDVIPEDDSSDENITGYDADLMRARASLSAEEEKKLLRRVDWRIVPLCAVMYAVKSIDASNVSQDWLLCTFLLTYDQVSNARIMDRGTPHNIMTELKMTANQYNLVTTMYYVRFMSVMVHEIRTKAF